MAIFLVVINLILDVFSFWAGTGGFTAYIRAILVYGTFYYFVVQNRINFNKNVWVIIFSIYVLLQLIFAEDFIYSSRVSLAVLSSILMYYVGYAAIRNEKDFDKYISTYLWVYLLLILNAVISNYFNLGYDDYTRQQDYLAGGLNDMWNNFTYAVLFFPILLIKSQRKNIVIILFIIVFILLVLSIKRIAIAGAVLGLFFYATKIGMTTRQFALSLILLILLVVTSPLYFDLLETRFQARQGEGRFEERFYETEGRYVETIFMIEEFYSLEDLEHSLLGLKAFDSRGAFGGGIGIYRQLHSDFNLIPYTVGIVGFMLYILMYIRLYSNYKNLSSSLRRLSLHKTELYPFYLYSVLFWMSLFTSFAGQMHQTTFRTMIFFSLGAIAKYYDNKFEKNEKSSYSLQR